METADIPLSQLMGKASELIPWFIDAEITDIFVHGNSKLYVEKMGKLEERQNPFPRISDVHDFIERCLVPLGKRIDALRPFVDGRLQDGSRFHIILPPLALEGPLISIRKRRKGSSLKLSDFGDDRSVEYLRKAVKDRRNVLVIGATGSGKTSLLRALIECVPANERVIIVEETQELNPNHPHALTLESRPPSPDGAGEVTLRTLVRNTLRMRPDRIIIGECRGEEAFEILQAMNTGHRGSFCTLHANGPRDGLRRLEGLVLMAGFSVPLPTIRDWIAHNIQLVVHLEKREGARQMVEIASVHGLEGDAYRLETIYMRRCPSSFRGAS